MSETSPADRSAPVADAPSPWSIGSLAGRPARLSVVVVSVLVESIVSGRYPPGSMLPPEPMLCQSFDVSRSVVREALKVLEEKGLAHARQGQGTTVASPDEWNLLDPLVLDATIRADQSLQILDQLVDVRAALEAEMVRTAARLMTAADLSELDSVVEELLRHVRDPEGYKVIDTRFHDVIMRCSGNRLGRSIIHAIHPHARASTRYNPPTDEEDTRLAHEGHVAIYKHLRDHDGDAAATAMEDHIRGTWTQRKQKRA